MLSFAKSSVLILDILGLSLKRIRRRIAHRSFPCSGFRASGFPPRRPPKNSEHERLHPIGGLPTTRLPILNGSRDVARCINGSGSLPLGEAAARCDELRSPVHFSIWFPACMSWDRVFTAIPSRRLPLRASNPRRCRRCSASVARCYAWPI